MALRVFPYAHTNPIYVTVDDAPFTAIKDSLQWCLMGVEQCWQEKEPTYAPAEQADAQAAYQHARDIYNAMLPQSEQ